MPNNEPHRTSLSLGLLSFNKKFYFFSGEGNYNFYVRFTMYLIIQTVMTLESVSVGCYTVFLYHQGSVAFLSFSTNINTENIRVMPKYVPMGEEDKTMLILGLYIQKKKIQREV